MRILIVEPYFTGSHASWAEGYVCNSRHEVEILKLSGAYWKWRMHGGAVTLARQFLDSGKRPPDVILATDMLDVTTFQALTRSVTANTPFAMYFHENQLTYPWSPTDRDVAAGRDRHYGFINYSSALACDRVLFNSRYHRDSFHDGVEKLLRHFPDHNELGSIDTLRAKSAVVPLGLDLERFDGYAAPVASAPVILWNHRWEYDKNPDEFFTTLNELAREDVPFSLIVLGENFSRKPDVFDRARESLGSRVIQFGYAESFEEYAGWLRASDILPVTSNQDFFGASIVEAVYCGCRPLLPDRLAYPELIPRALHSQVFYDDGEFKHRLRQLLESDERSLSGLREAVAGFDWRKIAPQLDNEMVRLRDGVQCD